MSEEVLPFNGNRQLGFLGHVLTNKTYYHQVKPKIDKRWFNDPWAGETYGLWCSWNTAYDKNNEKLPSFDEIQNSTNFIALTEDRKNKVRAVLAQAISAKDIFDWDSIVIELTAWLKCRIYLEDVTKSTELFNGKKFEEAFKILETSVQKYQDIKFFPDDTVDFLDWRAHFAKTVAEKQNGLTTGLNILDKLIDPTCSVGCLLPGDTTLLMAPSNLGKTTCMITMAIANCFQGKNVLFITHEGRKEDIVDKMWCNATSRQKGELLSLYTQDEQLFQGTAYFFQKHLTYLPINDPSQMMVENVARIIERKQAEKISREGHGYDLLIVDYPAKLQAEQSNKVHMQFRHLEHFVYNYFVQLALKHNFHALLAIQTNREASKNNRYQGQHGTQNRLVSLEDVAESWGPITVATNIISINRNESYGDKVIYHICKTRSSETGLSVLAKSDYGRAMTHSNALGGLWYKGDTALTSVTPELLNQYANQCIPPEKLHEIENSQSR